MAPWRPITRGKPNMMGENEGHIGYFDVSIMLDREPPEDWLNFFESPVGIGIPYGHQPICLEGNEITFSVREDELTSYVKFVDGIIKSANDRYVTEVLPKLAADADRLAPPEAGEETRLDDLRKKGDEM